MSVGVRKSFRPLKDWDGGLVDKGRYTEPGLEWQISARYDFDASPMATHQGKVILDSSITFPFLGEDSDGYDCTDENCEGLQSMNSILCSLVKASYRVHASMVIQ